MKTYKIFQNRLHPYWYYYPIRHCNLLLQTCFSFDNYYTQDMWNISSNKKVSIEFKDLGFFQFINYPVPKLLEEQTVPTKSNNISFKFLNDINVHVENSLILNDLIFRCSTVPSFSTKKRFERRWYVTYISCINFVESMDGLSPPWIFAAVSCWVHVTIKKYRSYRYDKVKTNNNISNNILLLSLEFLSARYTLYNMKKILFIWSRKSWICNTSIWTIKYIHISILNQKNCRLWNKKKKWL